MMYKELSVSIPGYPAYVPHGNLVAIWGDSRVILGTCEEVELKFKKWVVMHKRSYAKLLQLNPTRTE